MAIAINNKGVTNTIRQKVEKNVFDEVKISYIQPDGCAAEGTGTKTSGSNQHVQGRYNEVLSSEPAYDESSNVTDYGYAHIIGNGTEGSPSNMHLVDWLGNSWYSGKLFLGGDGITLNKEDFSGEGDYNPKTLLKVSGNIEVEGDIIANGSTLQMDRVHGIEGKGENDSNEYYLINTYQEIIEEDVVKDRNMNFYPQMKDSNGNESPIEATLGKDTNPFSDIYLSSGLAFIDNAIKTYVANSSEGLTMQNDEDANFYIKDFYGKSDFAVEPQASFYGGVKITNSPENDDNDNSCKMTYGEEDGVRYLEISF